MSNYLDPILTEHANLQGWCSSEKAAMLASLVFAARPKVIVEIGVFGGKSFIPMAMALKAVGGGVAIGIDPWSRDESIKNESKENVEWWGKLDHGAIYAGFVDSITRLGLQNHTHISRMPSDSVAPPSNIDILHIDGSHTQQALRDAERFSIHVRVGGYCFMDDIGWDGGGPASGVTFIESIGFKKLYHMDTGAMFQRVK